jgi:hypothetical protein
VAIRLMLQGPAAGSSGSFLSAAVPAEALGPAPGPGGAWPEGVGPTDSSISSMLAAANSCRDYEVSWA